MKIFIKETSTFVALSLIDPESGDDFVIHFMENTSALQNGSFVWDDEIKAYVSDRATFVLWEK